MGSAAGPLVGHFPTPPLRPRRSKGELSLDKGAPHNVDEVAALYIGEKSECAPWGLSNKRAAKFGTLATCDASKANQAAVAALRDAYAASVKGDARAFQAARGKFLSALATTLVQVRGRAQ